MERIFPDGEEAVRERAPGPIHVETAVFDQVVDPVAYTCLKFMLVREGACLVHSAYGREPARPGSLVIVCAGMLCGGIPEPSVRVTTAYVSLDYLLDQLTWRLNGLLLDRHEAEAIAAKAFRHSMWADRLKPGVAAEMGDLLDRVEQIQREGGGFYDIEATFASVLSLLVPLLPYENISSGPVRSLAGEGEGGRFPPLRREIVSVGQAVQAELSRTWTLTDLAGIAHLSERQLGRAFRESYGLPPMSYVSMLRAKEMARLLREEPDCSVEAVGRMVGWRGRSHARVKFTALLGISPDEYRRRARGLDLATFGPDTAETAVEGS
jgi:AraC-like DNA-binding protein